MSASATYVDTWRRYHAGANGHVSPDDLEATEAAIIAEQTRRREADEAASRPPDFQPAGNHATPATAGLLAQRVLLGRKVRDGVPPPTFLSTPTLGDHIFYEMQSGVVSGHKKSGKTFGVASAAMDYMSAGLPAVYVDFENGEDTFAERMILLGADPDLLDEHFHYIPFPHGLTLASFSAELEAIAASDALPGAFVVFDSLRGLIARLNPGGRDALSVNDPQAIERVMNPIMQACKVNGLTAVTIDHSTKTGSDADEYSTANSAAKEAAVDYVYFWTKVEPYNHDTEGVVKLTATSDRRGRLQRERYWRVGGQGDEGTFRFAPADADEVGNMRRIRQDVLEYLAEHEGQWFTKRQVRDEIKGRSADIGRALDLVAGSNVYVHEKESTKRGEPSAYTYDRGLDSGSDE